MEIIVTNITQIASYNFMLNGSFDSIVNSVKYWRNLFNCIRKFLQFELICNVLAITIRIFGGIASRDSPFNSIQMLC